MYYSYSLCRRGTSISLARLSVTPPKCSSHTAEDLVPEERHQVYMPLRLIVYSRLDRPLEINDIFASLEDEAGTGFIALQTLVTWRIKGSWLDERRKR